MSKHHNSDILFEKENDYHHKKTFKDKLKSFGVGFVLMMIFAGMGMWGIGGFDRNSNENYVAQIDDEIITEYHVQEEMVKFKKKMPEESLKPYIRSLAIQDLILSKILIREAKELNLDLSDDIIAQYIAKNKMFQEDGVFSQNKFINFLSTAELTESEYIDKIKQKLVTDVIVSIVGFPKVDFSNLAMYHLKTEQQKRIIDLFIIPNNKSAISLSEQELSDFYLSHKNLFVEQQHIDIEYFSFDSILKKSNITVTQKELDEEFNKAYNGKHLERRAINLLSLTSQEDVDKALFLLKNRKKNFLEVASIFDKKDKDVTIDSVGYFDLQPYVRDVVFELPINKISDSIKISSDKFIIVQVNKIMSEKLDISEKNRILNSISEKILKQKQCEKFMSDRNQIRDLISSGKEIQDIAKIFDVNIIKTNIVQNKGDNKFNNLFNKNDITENFVDIIENEECSFDLIKVINIQQSRNKDFNEAYEDVVSSLKKIKSEESVLNQANEVKNQLEKIDLKNSNLINNFIKGRNINVIKNLSISQKNNNELITEELKNYIYKAKVNDIIGPFPTKDNSFAIIIVNNIDNKVSYKKTDLDFISSEIWQEKQHNMQDLYKNYLYKKYNVRLYDKK